jgi:hypothetical protein
MLTFLLISYILAHDITISTKLTCDCSAVYHQSLGRRSNSKFANCGLCSTCFFFLASLIFFKWQESDKGRYACRRTRIYTSTHISVRLVQQRITIDFHGACQLSQDRQHMNQILRLSRIFYV